MLSKRLSALRESKGLTQKELSTRLGMARTTYSGYENGTREPDHQTLQKFANFFDVSIDYLLTGETPQQAVPSFATSKDKRDLKKFLEQSDVMFDGVPLTDEDKDVVQGMMERMFWRAKEKNKRKPKDDT